MGRRPHYHVYVIELDDRVWNHARFRRANPDYQLGQPFVYVGMTGLDPDVRFDKHKAGLQANTYARNHGLRLLPQLYERYNPMGYDEARQMEVELAIALRARGFGVWQA
ncbi:MAG: hypothetical protein IPK34_18010 [Ramlibacter sp.]|jgi:predicted GIY-YIG superfamily endonuclease|nr:hypothetical protein [Ramlibacter sp.]